MLIETESSITMLAGWRLTHAVKEIAFHRVYSTMKPIEESIHRKLSEVFGPTHLQIINESNMHNVPKGSETHFKVVVISDKFESQPLIKRHRMINEVLHDELNNGVHALSIVAKTPQQWKDSGQQVHKSPPCRGGSAM